MSTSVITFCNNAVELINSHINIEKIDYDSGFGMRLILNLGVIKVKNDVFAYQNLDSDTLHFTCDGELKI